MNLTRFFSTNSSFFRSHQNIQVEDRFPFLQDFGSKFREALTLIRPAYVEYIKEVSTADMAISLNAAVFLRVFCEEIKAKRILDLGSGFSSFILRSYALSQDKTFVCSVDDNPEYLERTREYLTVHNLPTERLFLWKEFLQARLRNFDFVLHDLGNMDLRAKTLWKVLKLAKRGGVILLDDMHKRPYAKFVSNNLRPAQICHYFNLDAYTLDEFGRYCGLLTDYEDGLINHFLIQMYRIPAKFQHFDDVHNKTNKELSALNNF